MSERQKKCRYCLPFFRKDRAEWHCLFDKEKREKDSEHIVTEEECETCKNFKSRYIEYPIQVDSLELKPFTFDHMVHETGTLVAVRPCKKEYGDKTYLGILLGDLPYASHAGYLEEEKKLTISAMTNPCIFVPELKTLVWGMGSWWHEIQSPEELRDITDDTIQSQWYVQLLKEMSETEKK